MVSHLDEQRKSGLELIQSRKIDSIFQKSTGIADDALQSEREAAMNYLGLTDSDPNTFIFVSLSMPDSLIKAYLREAIWSGAIVVVKGLTPGMTLSEFVKTNLIPLIGRKGATATLQIDPRLYDAFDISTVPSIVHSSVSSMSICDRTVNTSYKPQLTFYSCPPVDKNQYMKVSGAVSLRWSLEQFAEAGSESAAKTLATLDQYLPEPTEKDQHHYKSDWDDVPTPAHEMYLELAK